MPLDLATATPINDSSTHVQNRWLDASSLMVLWGFVKLECQGSLKRSGADEGQGILVNGNATLSSLWE